VRSANETTTSHRGKSQGIEHDEWLGRKLREKTVRGGEAGQRKETKQRAHLTKSPNWPNPPSKTYKQTIDLRPPITANSPPNPLSHLQTTTKHYQDVNRKLSIHFHHRSQSAYSFLQCWTVKPRLILDQRWTFWQRLTQSCTGSKAIHWVLGPHVCEKK